MTWTRLSDDFTERADLADLSHADRWHYLALIQLCSRSGRLNGHLRRVDALRCSDHPEPAAALDRLAAAGLIEPRGTTVVVVQIGDHIPPPSAVAKSTLRVQRHRLHAIGDHSLCLRSHCPDAPETRSETRSETEPLGTGQDRTGRDKLEVRESLEMQVTEWEGSTYPEGCGVIGRPERRVIHTPLQPLSRSATIEP